MSVIIENLVRLGVSREQAEVLDYMYRNTQAHGFLAAEMGLTDEDMDPLMKAGWIRPVNVGKVKNKYYLMWQNNDLFKILQQLIDERAEAFKSDKRLIYEIKKSLDKKLVNKSRKPPRILGKPRTQAAWRRYGLMQNNKRKDKEMYCNSQKDLNMLKKRQEKADKLEVLRKFREEQKLVKETVDNNLDDNLDDSRNDEVNDVNTEVN